MYRNIGAGKHLWCNHLHTWIALKQAFQSTSLSFSVSNTVKQGCVLAPVLFNLFFTCILRQAVGNMDKGVYVRFHYDGSIFDLRRLTAETKTLHSPIQEALFADDYALMAHKPGNLQAMLNSFSDASNSAWQLALAKVRCFSSMHLTMLLHSQESSSMM